MVKHPTEKAIAGILRLRPQYLTLNEIRLELDEISEKLALPGERKHHNFSAADDEGFLKDILRGLYRKGCIEFKEVCGIQRFRHRPELKKLGWSATREDTGMFLDDRMRMTRRGRRMNPAKIVAWLNCNDGVFSVNVVSSKFEVTHPIPAFIDDLEDAVRWVYAHSRWAK